MLIGGLFAIDSVVFGEEEPQLSPHIFVNQVGYLPSSSNVAMVSSPMGLAFVVREEESGDKVLKAMPHLAEAEDQSSGACLWVADFSVLDSTGEYYLEVEGLGRSYPFAVKSNVYQQVAQKALKAFYFQRSGIDLVEPYAEKWSRKAQHQGDAIVYGTEEEEESEEIDASGGWYDGGDEGKYVVNGSFAAGILLLLHEISPELFVDRSLNIPESGNDVPDVLDEVHWELEWLLKMQNEIGGVHHKVAAKESHTLSKNDDKNERYVMQVSTAATASACAVWAKASRLYSPHDATFAQRCLEAAQRAWFYLEQHPNDGGFTNPDEVLTKTYNDEDDSDERIWAAIELYLTLKNERFLEVIQALMNKRVPLLSASGYWGNVMPLAVTSILLEEENFSEKWVNEAKEDLISLANSFVETSRRDGLRLTLEEGEFNWGSNATILQNAFILRVASLVEERSAYQQTMLDQLHYILGRNPQSMCYVTGSGSHSPLHPHHPFSLKDKVEEPVPGLLVGGPNQFLNDSILKEHFNEETPPALTYADHEESYSSNEVSLGWNAVLAFVASALIP